VVVNPLVVQKSAIAARGAGDDNVQRLQSLLNGRLTTIAAKADEILRKSQDELADLKREEFIRYFNQASRHASLACRFSSASFSRMRCR
jgi:hypothetical protein